MLAAQRTYIVAIATFVIVTTLFFYAFGDQGVFVVARITRPYVPSRSCYRASFTDTRCRSSNPTLRDTVASLFASIKHDPSATGYVDPSGTYYEGGSETIWTKPLGKKVLIVDIDTRVPTGENELLNPERLDWENLKTEGAGLVSNSIMNHYLYAMVHGYDYKFYQARDMKDHYNTWILPHVLRELIPEYQFVIVMDADVTIAHPDVPLSGCSTAGASNSTHP